MSPEQAAGDLDRLGPRSDVYSLGATLYCLLTGQPPFEGDDIGEILRRVQAGDFRAPRAVDPSLDKALEAVCLRAMATKTEDRYAGCHALAEDVERWMADEPVTAYPEPWTRTLVRWLTRHRTGVTGVAAAVLAGVVGLSAVLAVQTQANAQLIRSKQAVQARYDLAVEAIKTFHTGVSEDFLLQQDQFKELRDRLLKSASDFYGKLGALLGKETDVASRRALAQSNFELAELTGNVGDKKAALAAHRSVLAAREALAADQGADNLAEVDVGRSLTAVASLLETTGKTEEALAAYRRSESLLAGLAASDPAALAALADCRSGLGLLLIRAGRSAQALAAYRLARADQQALAAGRGASNNARRDLGVTVNRIGIVLHQAGKPAEAEAEYRRAMEIFEKLAADNPAVTVFRRLLATTHSNLGLLLSQMGKPAEAEPELRRAVEILEKLAADNPAVTLFRVGQSYAQNNLAGALRLLGRAAEARDGYDRAISLKERLVQENPTTTEFRFALAESLRRRGLARRDQGDAAGAAADARRALGLYEALPPRSAWEWFETACCHAALCGLAGHDGSGISADDAHAEADAAMALLRRAAAMGYRSPDAHRTEDALDPLRDRDDFRLLMMDSAFPADAFAP
jgi:serine/threonine-protein kinase